MVPWLVLGSVLLVPTAAFLLWSWRSSRNEMTKASSCCTEPLMAQLSKTPYAHFASPPWFAWIGLLARTAWAASASGAATGSSGRERVVARSGA
jgi:hypothetical protein